MGECGAARLAVVAGRGGVALVVLVVLALAFVGLLAFLPEEFGEGAELEVVDLVAPAEDDVLGGGFVDLGGGHAEGDDAGGAVFEFQRHAVVEGGVDAGQGGEGFVEADGGDVVHGGGYVGARGGVFDEAQIAARHGGEPGGVGVVGADAVDGLVAVGDVDGLEVVAEEGQGGQTAIGEVPVGQHLQDGGEEAEAGLMGVAACVGCQEGGYHDVAGVGADGAVLGVEGARLAAALGILDACVALFDALLQDAEVLAEGLERLGAVAVACVAASGEGRLQGDGGHVEGAGLSGGVALVHVLHGLAAVAGVRHGEVYLEVGEGFEGGLQLEVGGGAGGGWRGHAVGTEQPAVVLGLVDVGVADESEGVLQSGLHDAAGAVLAEHVADVGHEAREREVVGVAIGDTDVAQHHGEAGCGLGHGVEFVLLQLGLGDDVDAHLGGVEVADFYLVLVQLLELQLVFVSGFVAGGDDDALRLLVVGHGDGGVGLQLYVLGKAFLLLVALLLALALGVALPLGRLGLLAGQDAVDGHALLLGLLLGLLAGLFLFLLFLLLSFLFLLLVVGLLLRCTLGLGGCEALVGFLQECGVVVEGLHGQLAVHVDGALRGDGVAQCAAVFLFGAALPGVGAVVRGVGRNPVEGGYLVDGDAVGELDRLVVVEGTAEVAETVADGVLPGVVGVGIEVFVDGCVGFLDLGMGAALEGEVEGLEDVPLEGEFSVPEVGLGEGDGYGLVVVEVFDVAFLQFVVGAGEVGVEGEILGGEGQVLLLEEGEPLGLCLQILEGFPCLPVGAPRVVHACAPLAVVLVDGGDAFALAAAPGVVEGEVGGVVGHGVLEGGDVDLDA